METIAITSWLFFSVFSYLLISSPPSCDPDLIRLITVGTSQIRLLTLSYIIWTLLALRLLPLHNNCCLRVYYQRLLLHLRTQSAAGDVLCFFFASNCSHWSLILATFKKKDNMNHAQKNGLRSVVGPTRGVKTFS